MDYEEVLAEETLKLINDDEWFTETIGVDGYGSGPMADEQTTTLLRAAYLADDGDQFLRVVKSYAQPAFIGVAECKANDRVLTDAAFRQECIDARGDELRDIRIEERDDG